MNDGNIGDEPCLLPIYEVTSEWNRSIKSLSEASIDVGYIFVKGGKSDGSGNPLQDARWYLAWIREHHGGWSMHCLRWHAKGKGNTQYSQSAVWWFIRSVGCGGRNHDGCRRRCLLKIATGEHESSFIHNRTKRRSTSWTEGNRYSPKNKLVRNIMWQHPRWKFFAAFCLKIKIIGRGIIGVPSFWGIEEDDEECMKIFFMIFF